MLSPPSWAMVKAVFALVNDPSTLDECFLVSLCSSNPGSIANTSPHSKPIASVTPSALAGSSCSPLSSQLDHSVPASQTCPRPSPPLPSGISLLLHRGMTKMSLKVLFTLSHCPVCLLSYVCASSWRYQAHPVQWKSLWRHVPKFTPWWERSKDAYSACSGIKTWLYR